MSTYQKYKTNGKGKLTPQEVAEVRYILKNGWKQVWVADLYGVSTAAIWQLNEGYSYAYVKKIIK